MTLQDRKITVLGEVASCSFLLLQPADGDEPGMQEEEFRLLKDLCSETACALAFFSVDWWQDLTPWPAAPVFRGQPGFGDGAERTLAFVTQALLPALLPAGKRPRVILGGYSLAGLFALWAGYRTDRFDGIVAASPSVWYPGWGEHAAAQAFRAKQAYLSLGDKEAKTRNPVMRTVDEAIRAQQASLEKQGIPSVLEWNPGNHFVDAALRTAKGFAHCMKNLEERY